MEFLELKQNLIRLLEPHLNVNFLFVLYLN